MKDMLEGDNMYTCSKCQKKVRAEKRACFRRLPKILCFNTMRYTFNMVTMMKEKVNSHFSFPLHLEMPGYMEENLIQSDKLPSELDFLMPCYKLYVLLGITPLLRVLFLLNCMSLNGCSHICKPTTTLRSKQGRWRVGGREVGATAPPTALWDQLRPKHSNDKNWVAIQIEPKAPPHGPAAACWV